MFSYSHVVTLLVSFFSYRMIFWILIRFLSMCISIFRHCMLYTRICSRQVAGLLTVVSNRYVCYVPGYYYTPQLPCMSTCLPKCRAPSLFFFHIRFLITHHSGILTFVSFTCNGVCVHNISCFLGCTLVCICVYLKIMISRYNMHHACMRM